MTLVLTFVSRGQVIQVSDRLVTLKGKNRAFDPIANKCVVYKARNAIVTMGYSGPAYIDGVPTDQWIAQTLSGEVLHHRNGNQVISLGRKCCRRSVDQSIHHLCAALDSRPEPRKYGLFINIAGYKLIGKAIFPFITELKWGPQLKTFKNQTTKRPWLWKKNPICIGAIGSGENHAISVIKNEIAKFSRIPTRPTSDDIERMLVQTLVEVSNKDKTVGSNAVSIRMSPAYYGCKFFPANQHSVKLSTSSSQHTLSVHHTPWIVGENSTYPPSALIGELKIHLGEIDFIVTGAQPPKGILAMSSGLQRPNPPGHRP